ncbi:MAG: IPT/TIG domain-containing protein [Leucothrix sp.]
MLSHVFSKKSSVVSAVLSCMLLAVTWSHASHAAEITAFSPTGGPAGTEVIITGSGFTETNNVIFNKSGSLLSPNFTIESDSTIRATAPENPWGRTVSFIITSPQSTTVTMVESSMTKISTEIYMGSGGRSVFVESTGFLNGLGGGNVVYVEAGGTVAGLGSGGNVFFLESQATLKCCGGGGSNTIFYEPGAAIINNAGNSRGYTAHEVAYVNVSFLPSLYDYNHMPKAADLDDKKGDPKNTDVVTSPDT